MSSEFANTLKDFVKKVMPKSMYATVKSIQGKTITVLTVSSDIEISKVYLCLDAADSSFFLIPKVGSTVLISPVEGMSNNYYVSMVSEVTGINFGDTGDYLASVNKLVQSNNILIGHINTLRNLYNTHTHSGNGVVTTNQDINTTQTINQDSIKDDRFNS